MGLEGMGNIVDNMAKIFNKLGKTDQDGSKLEREKNCTKLFIGQP